MNDHNRFRTTNHHGFERPFRLLFRHRIRSDSILRLDLLRLLCMRLSIDRIHLTIRIECTHRRMGHQRVQTVLLNNLNQFRSIVLIRCIPAFFESVRPPLIILWCNLETGLISGALQEKRMIIETLRGIGILAETFAFTVIVIIINRPHPVIITLDAEMVIGVRCQFALSGSGLQERLRHRDGCRYAIFGLVLNCGHLPVLDVIEIGLVLRTKAHRRDQKQCQKEYFFHIQFSIFTKTATKVQKNLHTCKKSSNFVP